MHKHTYSHQYDFSLYLFAVVFVWGFVKNSSIVVFCTYFFVYVLCSTLAMQISLLWRNILAGLLGNVSNVHVNRPLAMAELVKCCFLYDEQKKMLLLKWLWLVFLLRDSQRNENRTCCRSDSNLFFPHEHQGSVCLELLLTLKLFQWSWISISFGFNKRLSVLIESVTLIIHCSVSQYVLCALEREHSTPQNLYGCLWHCLYFACLIHKLPLDSSTHTLPTPFPFYPV